MTPTLSLRRWLALSAAAGIGGALAIAVGAGWWSWETQQRVLNQNLVATSGAIVSSVEREIDQAVALARGLAVSRALARGDLREFEAEAREALAAYGYALSLNPGDSGRQLLNTFFPPGAALPTLPVDADWIDPAVKQGHPVLKPLVRSRLDGAWIFILQVPVRDSTGALPYVINLRLGVAALQRILDEQKLPSNWIAAISDSTSRIAARSLDPEKFVGKPLYTNRAETGSAFTAPVYEGYTVLAGRAVSSRYGIEARVGVPVPSVTRTFLGPAALSGLAALAISALAFSFCAVLITRLARGITALSGATEALADGAPISLPPFAIRELALVGEGMRRASEVVRENTHFLYQRIAEITANLRREAEERQKAEASLAQSRRLEALGQLTGGLAHDLNNVLLIVSGNLELIDRHAGARDRVQQLARAAQKGIERGGGLIRSLLAFAGKQPFNTKIVNLNVLIQEFAPILKGAAGGSIEVQMMLSPSLQPCRVDPAQFQAALLNLVTNAVAAMPNGGRLTIETSNIDAHAMAAPGFRLNTGDYVCVVVSDTGTGMTPEVAERAFEPFYTTKDVGVGHGLGLSQVHGFVKQSGGEIELRSEPNVGTTFRLYIPIAADEPPSSPEQEHPAEEPASPGTATILIVDDDADVRDVIKANLQSLGYRTLEAHDGRSAIESLARSPVDLVVTDFAMPGGMSGDDVAGHVRANFPNVPVVLISGYVKRGERPDGVIVLQKPVKTAELSNVIRRALATRVRQ